MNTLERAKYRAKRIDNGEWLVASICDGMHTKGDGKFLFWSGEFWAAVDKETLGQFTGVKDKNGKDIFEGDIVSDFGDCIYPIVWSQNQCSFYADGQELLEDVDMCDGWISYVAGNIHDNPELLEVSK